MFVNIILLSFLVGISSVTCNPILQALALEPSTSCPCHNESPTTPLILPINANAYQLPLVQNLLPNVIQNQMTPCQNPLTACQNSMSMSQDQLPSYQNQIPRQKQLMLQNLLQNPLFTSNVNLMSNPNPYQTEMILTNNQCNVCKNKPLQISRNTINPSYANSVLENPAVKTILDPNTRLYNQYGVEIRKSPYNVPNVVNNYIIVPPDVLMEDCKKDRNSKIIEERREKNKKRKGKRKNRKNRKDVQSGYEMNEETKNKLTPLNENNTKIDETQLTTEVTNISTNHNEILDAHGVILDQNINNVILNQTTRTEQPLNIDNYTEINVPQSKSTGELKIPKNEPIENQMQMPNMNIQAPVRNIYNSPYTEITRSNFCNSPCLSNSYQYVSTGVDNNSKYNGMLDRYLQFYNNDQNTNVHEGQLFGSNNQVSARSNDKHINSIDMSKYNFTKGNGKPKIINSQNKPTTMTLNVHLQPQNKEEFVVQDFKRKFPNIPENLVRDLIRHMKKYLQQEQNSITNQYPMFPMNFEEFYRTPFYNTPRSSKNGRKKSNKKNNRRRNETLKNKNDSNKDTTADITTRLNGTDINNAATSTESGKHQETSNSTEENKIKELETGKSLKEIEPVEKVETTFVIENTNTSVRANKSETLLDGIEEVGENNGNQDSKLPVNIEDTAFKIQHEAVKAENTQSITSPELGKEDIVHPMPMNGVDDYYPDFTVDNHAYFLNSMEDVDLENLEDRYHYTTDRNLSPKIEQTTEAKVQFRTPPTLEKPDFETKKIESRKTNSEDTIYKPEFTNKDIHHNKVSTYSNTKTPQYNLKEKPSRNISGKLSESRKIETVFANSKVIKYGPNHDDATINLESVTEPNIARNSKKEQDEDRDMKWPSKGESTIVYATSIPNVY